MTVGLWRPKLLETRAALPTWAAAESPEFTEYDWAWHHAYGLHSNIPLCCVEAWIRDRRRGVRNMVALRADPMGFRAKYVRCSQCIISGHLAELHDCDPQHNEVCAAWLPEESPEWVPVATPEEVREALAKMGGEPIEGEFQCAPAPGPVDPMDIEEFEPTAANLHPDGTVTFSGIVTKWRKAE